MVTVLFLDLHARKGPFPGKCPFLPCKTKNKKICFQLDVYLPLQKEEQGEWSKMKWRSKTDLKQYHYNQFIRICESVTLSLSCVCVLYILLI